MSPRSNVDARYAVLVVEEDAFLRAEAVDIALDAGFRVYEARNAARAISLLENHGDIRILFTDTDMRGTMDGIALAKAVRDRWPPVHVLVVSCRSGVTEADLPPDAALFSKPYEPQSVVDALSAFGDRIAA